MVVPLLRGLAKAGAQFGDLRFAVLNGKTKVGGCDHYSSPCGATRSDPLPRPLGQFAEATAEPDRIFRNPSLDELIGAVSRALPSYWRRSARTHRSLLNARSDSLRPGQAALRMLPASRRPRSKNH
jgi:hypothetical protein